MTGAALHRLLLDWEAGKNPLPDFALLSFSALAFHDPSSKNSISSSDDWVESSISRYKLQEHTNGHIRDAHFDTSGGELGHPPHLDMFTLRTGVGLLTYPVILVTPLPQPNPLYGMHQR